MGERVERVQTYVTEPQMAQAIIEAWRELFGAEPSKEQVTMVLAQNALETGNRKSMWNFNVGNITTDGKGQFDYYDDLTTDEQIKPGVWKKMNLKYRAYQSLRDGMIDYLKLLSGGHYASAWQHILHPDPVAFSKALKAGGYYTADESKYTKALTGLYSQISKSDSYEKAQEGNVGQTPSMVAMRRRAPSAPSGGLEAILNNYIEKILAAASSDVSLKKIYKQSLPNHNILIQITAPDHTSAIEFSRVLCTALDEDLLSSSYPHTDGHLVEVECSIAGPQKECFAAVQQMTQAVAETFKDATSKIGGIVVKNKCIMDKKSSYQPISPRTADTNYRKFLLKFV